MDEQATATQSNSVRQIEQEAQLPQRNSASAAHVYLGWLTDRAMHRTPRNRRGCTISDIQTFWFKKRWPEPVVNLQAYAYDWAARSGNRRIGSQPVL